MPQQSDKAMAPHWSQFLILLVGASFLFLEWLKPLPELTDTHSITPFALFFIFVLLVKWLRLPLLVEILFIGLVFLYAFHFLYIKGSFFSLMWGEYLLRKFLHSIHLLWQGDLFHHSFFVRTFSFYLLIWLVAVYVYRAMFIKKNLFFFFLCTIINLAILDTFSPIPQQGAIVRTIVVGLIMLALLEVIKIAQLNNRSMAYKTTFPYKPFFITLIVILLVTSVGYVAPKAAPSWPDPVAFIVSYSAQAGAGEDSTKVIGYGHNDESLGGPFQLDNQVVFRAFSTKRHYWRGESKDFYTGHGWIQSTEKADNDLLTGDAVPLALLSSEEGQGLLYEEKVNLEPLQTTIRMEKERYSTLFYPGQLKQFSSLPEAPFVAVDRKEAKLTFWERLSTPLYYEEVQMFSDYPSFQIKELRAANMEEVPIQLKERYTQLPAELPERVKKLAEEITKDKSNAYDKVKQIEIFLNSIDYEYETEDVAYPAENQDYVDQFLFETKKGYCNNFSSSMVVMLRSIGIPARWVKGFTFGTVESPYSEIPSYAQNNFSSDYPMETVVRNLNAHSWVEVYFPGSGWVPFEPTKGFTNYFSFALDIQDKKEEEQLSAELQERLQQQFPERNNDPDKEVMGQENTSFLGQKTLIIISSVLLAALCVALFLLRRKMFISWIIRRHAKKQDPQLFLKAYEVMIRISARFIQPIQPSQTLREYFSSMNRWKREEEFIPLTKTYEEMRYGDKEVELGHLQKAYLLWERLLKKMRS